MLKPPVEHNPKIRPLMSLWDVGYWRPYEILQTSSLFKTTTRFLVGIISHCTAVYKNTNPSPAVNATAAQTASHCHWNLNAFSWWKWFYFWSCNRVSLTLLKCCSYKNKDPISVSFTWLRLSRTNKASDSWTMLYPDNFRVNPGFLYY